MNFFRKQIEGKETLELEISSLKTEVQDLSENLKSLQEENAKLIEELTSLKTQTTELTKENEVIQEKLEESVEDNVELVQEVVKVDELAAMKATEIIAQTGIDPVEILPEDHAMTEDQVNVLDKVQQLSGKELQDFYKQYKNEIFKALRAKK